MLKVGVCSAMRTLQHSRAHGFVRYGSFLSQQQCVRNGINVTVVLCIKCVTVYSVVCADTYIQVYLHEPLLTTRWTHSKPQGIFCNCYRLCFVHPTYTVLSHDSHSFTLPYARSTIVVLCMGAIGQSSPFAVYTPFVRC